MQQCIGLWVHRSTSQIFHRFSPHGHKMTVTDSSILPQSCSKSGYGAAGVAKGTSCILSALIREEKNLFVNYPCMFHMPELGHMTTANDSEAFPVFRVGGALGSGRLGMFVGWVTYSVSHTNIGR